LHPDSGQSSLRFTHRVSRVPKTTLHFRRDPRTAGTPRRIPLVSSRTASNRGLLPSCGSCPPPHRDVATLVRRTPMARAKGMTCRSCGVEPKPHTVASNLSNTPANRHPRTVDRTMIRFASDINSSSHVGRARARPSITSPRKGLANHRTSLLANNQALEELLLDCLVSPELPSPICAVHKGLLHISQKRATSPATDTPPRWAIVSRLPRRTPLMLSTLPKHREPLTCARPHHESRDAEHHRLHVGTGTGSTGCSHQCVFHDRGHFTHIRRLQPTPDSCSAGGKQNTQLQKITSYLYIWLCMRSMARKRASYRIHSLSQLAARSSHPSRTRPRPPLQMGHSTSRLCSADESVTLTHRFQRRASYPPMGFCVPPKAELTHPGPSRCMRRPPK